jgi:hypothetical protein
MFYTALMFGFMNIIEGILSYIRELAFDKDAATPSLSTDFGGYSADLQPQIIIE